MKVMTVPTPLPGKTQPPARPEFGWAGKDLVQVVSDATRDGKPLHIDLPYHGMGFDSVVGNRKIVAPGPTDATAFKKLDAASFEQAVGAANQIASSHNVELNVDHRDPKELDAPLAVAVLQGKEGGWFATALEGGRGAVAVIDSGLTNATVRDVKQLNPDVKAVVGAYSWVNFTTDAINTPFTQQGRGGARLSVVRT